MAGGQRGAGGSFPATVHVGEEATCTLTLSNPGSVGARFLTVHATIPDAVTYLRSNPPAHPDGNSLVWTLDQLVSQDQITLEMVCKPSRVGLASSQVSVSTADGLHDSRTYQVQVLPTPRPLFKVEITGATTALLVNTPNGIQQTPATEQVVVSNVGTDGAANVRVRAELSPNLTHDSGVNPLEYDLGPLLPGARKTLPLIVKPLKPGKAPCGFPPW